MADDGSTSGGCWIYTGVYADGVNQSARRKPGREQSWVAPEWGWAWPAEPPHAVQPRLGRPRRQTVERAQGLRVVGRRRREVDRARRARLRDRPAARRSGPSRAPAASPGSPVTTRSSCRPTARAGCSRRPGCSTARCPRTTSRQSHRCATRSTASRPTHPRGVQTQGQLPEPVATRAQRSVFPYVFTTYRLTEHHTAGGMSRWVPFLSELQPEFFCEVSPALARERGLDPSRLGHYRHRPHRDRGAGAGHRTDRAADRRRPRRAPDRAALPLGRRAPTPTSPATRPTTCSA